MTRLLATVRCDLTLQVRNGFAAATAVVTLVWALVATQFAGLTLDWLLPSAIVGNLLVTTFYFIGGLVLLEKGDGTLAARRVTPLRLGEYLTAKVSTLTALSLVETLVLVGVITGGRVAVLPLLAGVVLAAALYCLIGFIAVAPYPAINEFLLPSVGVVLLLWLPLLATLAQWRPWPLYLHPLTAPLVLIEAAFAPVAPWQLVYGLLYAALWIGLLVEGCRRAQARWLGARGGG